MYKILLFSFLMFFSKSVCAQNVDPLAFACELSQGYSWEEIKDKEEFKGKTLKDSMDLVFTIDSLTSGKLIGNLGASEVVVRSTPESISFFEETLSGNLAITTIFRPDNVENNISWKAVHSRHMNLSGPLVSQYVGNCKVKN